MEGLQHKGQLLQDAVARGLVLGLPENHLNTFFETHNIGIMCADLTDVRGYVCLVIGNFENNQ